MKNYLTLFLVLILSVSALDAWADGKPVTTATKSEMTLAATATKTATTAPAGGLLQLNSVLGAVGLLVLAMAGTVWKYRRSRKAKAAEKAVETPAALQAPAVPSPEPPPPDFTSDKPKT